MNFPSGVRDEAGRLKSPEDTFPQFTDFLAKQQRPFWAWRGPSHLTPAFKDVDSPICTFSEGKPESCVPDATHETGKLHGEKNKKT